MSTRDVILEHLKAGGTLTKIRAISAPVLNDKLRRQSVSFAKAGMADQGAVDVVAIKKKIRGILP